MHAISLIYRFIHLVCRFVYVYYEIGSYPAEFSEQ